MRQYRSTLRFEKSLEKLPDNIADLFNKKFALFLNNMSHPSLRVRKIQGFANPDIWEASLTMDYRFTFEIDKDGVIVLRHIGHHSILDKKKV